MLFYYVPPGRAALEQRKLPLMLVAREALMGAEIDPIHEAGIARLEDFEGFGAGAGEALAFPNFIEPAGVAAVAIDEVFAADAEPASDPYVDCIRLCERAAGKHRRDGIQERNGHDG